MKPLKIEADHLVVAAETLKAGCDWVESRLGLAPVAGGKHAGMGTHNAVLSLGPGFYLEVIAIDPGVASPARTRWFDLDQPNLKAALREGPRLIHWAARTDDADAASARVPDLGAPIPMSRGDMHWRITVPEDGHLPGRGLVPTIIEWPDARHPSALLPDAGLRLVAIAGEHPDPATVRAPLALLGLSEVMKVTFGQSPRLAAMIRTRRGVATL
jgi:Glyoxalase-like domain